MLSTGYVLMAVLLSQFATLCIAGYAWRKAAIAQRYANDCAIWVQSENADSVSLAKMAELESQMLDVIDSHNRVQASIRKLRSRIGMQELRERDKIDVDIETTTDKNALRQKARARGLLR